MGIAWVSDYAGSGVPSGPGRPWASQEYLPGPRHRRPTLLARGGQAVVGRITALAGSHPVTGHPPAHHAAPAQRPERALVRRSEA